MNQNNKKREISPELTEKEFLEGTKSKYRRSYKPSVLVLLIIVIAAVISAVLLILNNNREKSTPQEGRQQGLASDFLSEATETEETIPPFFTVEVPHESIHDGSLILVNYEHEYVESPKRELVNIADNKTDLFNVSDDSSMLEKETLDSFRTFIDDFYSKTGDDCITVNSSYRSVEEQTDIYAYYENQFGEEYARNYVADPGYSEHHTGYAVDLTIRYSDGSSSIMQDYENIALFTDMSKNYGFILRFPDDKYYYTHINSEPWHYRFVGLPHSLIISELGLCLEEYIEYLKDYRTDTEVLTYSGEIGRCGFGSPDGSEYYIYYYEASESGNTVIEIPTGCDSYRIDGNNFDGFIVTVRMPKVEN